MEQLSPLQQGNNLLRVPCLQPRELCLGEGSSSSEACFPMACMPCPVSAAPTCLSGEPTGRRGAPLCSPCARGTG